MNESHLKVALFKTRQLCLSMGFNEVATSRVTTAASELIRNILKYAGDGQYCLSPIELEGKRGVELIVCDAGPGISDLENAMKDHVSSTGTLGLGLPGVERMMDYFSIKSEINQGTKVTVRKFL